MATIELVSGSAVWHRLKQTLKAARGPSFVAVAYFGKGAARLLPLRSGSVLVVDASTEAVKAGVTHPRDLLECHARGVKVCSAPRLHAKVYVFGKTAIIGSANVSRNSASTLMESAVVTTHQPTVTAAKGLVRDIAINEVGPNELKRLQKLYREPRFVPGHRRSRSPAQSIRTNQLELPSIRVVMLTRNTLTEQEAAEAKAGAGVARTRRQHPRTWINDYFTWTGRCAMQPRDRILVITREADGRSLVDPIASVTHVRRYRTTRGDGAIVYFEHPDRRRRTLKAIALKLGRGALSRLRREGNLSLKTSGQLYEFWSA